MPVELVQSFFSYDEEELQRVPKDIRGLRNYRVENLPEGQVGGTEFHRVRKEIVIGVAGQVRWECEDLYGNKREFILTPENGVWMPPLILHTYFVEENESGLAIVCNTLFPLPAHPATNDTYSLEEFRKYQENYAKR